MEHIVLRDFTRKRRKTKEKLKKVGRDDETILRVRTEEEERVKIRKEFDICSKYIYILTVFTIMLEEICDGTVSQNLLSFNLVYSDKDIIIIELT